MPVSRGAIEGILIKHVLDPSKYSPATYCPVEFPNSGATLRQGEVGRESWSCLWPLLQAPRQEAELETSHITQLPARSQRPGAEATA